MEMKMRMLPREDGIGTNKYELKLDKNISIMYVSGIFTLCVKKKTGKSIHIDEISGNKYPRVKLFKCLDVTQEFAGKITLEQKDVEVVEFFIATCIKQYEEDQREVTKTMLAKSADFESVPVFIKEAYSKVPDSVKNSNDQKMILTVMLNTLK